VGLRRRGIPREDISALRAAYVVLRDGGGAFLERAGALGADDSALVRELAEFVLASSDRQFLTPR
jgi:UDP-N-acetylglucosamine acyltransferase